MYDLVVIGNPSFDRFIPSKNNGARVASGPAINSIVAASKVGMENIAIVGAIGHDFETQFKSIMLDLGVPEYFTLDSDATGGLELKEAGNGEFTLHRCITSAKRIGIRDIPDEFLSATVILLSPMLQEIDEEVIEWICNSSDSYIYLDPQIVTSKDNGEIALVKDFDAFEKTQYALDVVQMNQQEASLFTGENDPFVAAELLVDMIAEMCILTRGSGGSLIYDGNEFSSVEAFPAEPLDTYCAGAVHLAGFLSSSVAGKSLDDCIVTANALASLKIENEGLNYHFSGAELKRRKTLVEETISHR